MPNRFVGKIKSGEIGSIGELKSEFKELAKLSHPDLLGPGSDAEAFRRLRDEYEAALRDFTKHLFFGARRPATGRSGGARDGERAASDGPSGPLGDEAWACLALFLKRGFPKSPRHEKEALRYEYARWRLLEALGPEPAEGFAACEAELLALKEEGSGALGAALRRALSLIQELIEFREKGLPAMRTQILLSLGALEADPRIGAGFRRFARSLAGELGIGAEIPDSSG